MNNFTTTKIEVEIDNVYPNPWNPNYQSKEVFEKEVASIRELGLLGSILVRERAGTYQILDGEHRWKACKEIGYTKIQVETMGEITDENAKMLTVLINNLRGKDDIEKRAKIFEALGAGQLSLLPFTEEEIENEKKLFKFDFSVYDTQEDESARKIATIIGFKLTAEENKVYQKALSIAKNHKMTSLQMFMKMLQNYLDINLGSSPGQTTHEI